MGKKSSPSPPPAPDPLATAQAQGAVNKETAIAQAALNRINEFSPYGSVTYKKGAMDTTTGIPQYSRKISLTPEAQAALDKQMGLTSQLYGLAGDQFERVSDTMARPFSFGDMPQIPGQEDLLGERRRIEDFLFNRQMERLDPIFQQDQERLTEDLVNQGFSRSSEGFGREMDRFSDARNDAINAALNSAIERGGIEQQNLFNQGLAGRQQGINEATYLRNLPLNEISALLGTGQVQSPSASGIAQVGLQSPDLTGNIYSNYQAALNANAQKQAANQAMMGNLFGLGGTLGSAAILACSRAFKREIGDVNLLSKVDSLPIKRWAYTGNIPAMPEGEHIGPYAEDFHEIFGVGSDKFINMVDIVGVCLGAIKELSAKVKELEARNG